MKIKINKYVVIIVVYLIIMGIILFIFTREEEKEEVDWRLYKVSPNYVLDDSEELVLYNQFQVEERLLFNLVGSDGIKDYYGYFYKDDGFYLSEESSFIKNVILINNVDYGSWEYDMDNMCYRLSLAEYRTLYKNFYGSEIEEINFDIEFVPAVYIDDSSICISDIKNTQYSKVIDTYLVDVEKSDEKIIIYEKVIFIDIEEDYLYFYKDSKQKELLCKLLTDIEIDTSFISNSEVVSNVLLEYKDKLDTYKYTYVKGVDTYYLESIKR